MKKKIMLITIIVFIITIALIIYPNIEITKGNKLYAMSYNENWDEWEENFCYNESYSYNKKRNISIYNWDIKKIGIFKCFVLEFKKGNICETEFLLKEEYINKIINEAKIIENEDKVDLKKLLKNKKAIVGNTRYSWNDEYKYIGFELDREYKEMYIYTNEENLIIIQIGNSDEAPKYIAYK